MKQLISVALLMVAFCLPAGLHGGGPSPAASAATVTCATNLKPINFVVYMYDPVTGEPDETTDSYVQGHVYWDDELVGNAPSIATDGHVYDPNTGLAIGLVAPSPAATNELK